MKKIIEVKGLKIGEGVPKICVPITHKSKEDILTMARKIKHTNVDLVEWRADYFEYISQWIEVENILRELKEILQDFPLIFTFRTLKEGGNLDISSESYFKLNSQVIRSKLVDIVDIELSLGNEGVKGLIHEASNFEVFTIISKHDFQKTPLKNEIIKTMCEMQKLEGNILKIAVMPKSKRDVLTLLEATEEMGRIYADRPIVTISMSDLGMISRVSGEIFGSDITFGIMDEESAPGQLPFENLKEILNILHGGNYF